MSIQSSVDCPHMCMAAVDEDGQARPAKRRRASHGNASRGSAKKAATQPGQEMSAPAQPVALSIKAEAAN